MKGNLCEQISSNWDAFCPCSLYTQLLSDLYNSIHIGTSNCNLKFNCDNSVTVQYSPCAYFSHYLPDINECLISNDNCTQTCINTAGSYECSCQTGYVLADDGINCNGELCKP